MGLQEPEQEQAKDRHSSPIIESSRDRNLWYG